MAEQAVASLAKRYVELADRAKRRQLTEVEANEIARLGAIIDTLQIMVANARA